MNYFKNCETLDEAKKLYYDLCKVHHPDKGGKTADFQDLLNQFHNFRPNELKYENELNDWRSQDFADIINELLKLPGLQITICGSWVWVSGNTKENKDKIKSISVEGYRIGWSATKLQWYFSPVGYRKKSKKVLSFEQI